MDSCNAIGNITSATENGVVTSYSYAGSQGSSYANPHAATSIGSLSFTYDVNGNLLSRSDSISHTWDYNNRLTKITYPGQSGRFGAMSSGEAGSGWQQFTKYVTYSYDSSPREEERMKVCSDHHNRKTKSYQAHRYDLL